MNASSMMDFSRPYAKTMSSDAPPHYVQDGKMFGMNGEEIGAEKVAADPINPIQPTPEPQAEQPKKRGRKPTK